MSGESQTEVPRYHVLLIGVDAYPIHPLAGCVNDVDAVRELLLQSGLGITEASIKRLVAPRADLGHQPVPDDQLATFANIRKALAELASSKVSSSDCVIIYYSGHGKRVPLLDAEGRTFRREALVPVDFVKDDNQHEYEWLFDCEFNQALREITKRTTSVTVLLDSCHSAGAFKNLDPGTAVRTLDLLHLEAVPDAPGRVHNLDGARGLGEDKAWLGRGIAACHVVVACHADEVARETPDASGKRNGLLTRAYVDAVKAVPVPERAELSWDRIWQRIRADVILGYPGQMPRMEGNPRRRVFGGPPVDGDAGIPVRCDGERYRIEAGTMGEVTEGAELAVYDRTTAHFPPIGSAEDLQTRLGVIRVESATLSDAKGVAVDATFAIPGGGRARVVKLGQTAPIRCAVDPADPEIAKRVAGSALIQLVGPAEASEIRLERHDGRWLLIDALHGNGSDRPVLFALTANQLPAVRAVLEHYHAYGAPMRMAKRAADDLVGGLEIRLLACPPEDLPAAKAQQAKLDDVVTNDAGFYQPAADHRVCVDVCNRSSEKLHVELFDATGAGEVMRLGRETIERGEVHRFWADGNLGVPWRLALPDGIARSRDRLIAIGKTSTANPLDYLCLERSFAAVVAACLVTGAGADRPFVSPPRPSERWAAAQVVVDIVRS